MNSTLHNAALSIISSAIDGVKPEAAVAEALRSFNADDYGRIHIVSIGKAAWRMAAAAATQLPRIDSGIVITKYGHVFGEIPGINCYEAGHPVPDENGVEATGKVLQLVSGLSERDCVVFLVSGGGSALFEAPRIPLSELQDISRQLLECGANITEINAIRKRLSLVKGGQFARVCSPARIFSIILSDVVGDALDVIASGPACPDMSSAADAKEIAAKYSLSLSSEALSFLDTGLNNPLDNVENHITGSVRELCSGAGRAAEALGYESEIIDTSLCCEAGEAARIICGEIKKRISDGRRVALIYGGETVVHVRGSGKGGRNQELALSAVKELAGLENCCLVSVGSDGTDGPTDAAGGYADGESAEDFRTAGVDYLRYLENNDSYNALNAIGGLVVTGPTGTNVNDVCVALIN